MTTNFQSRHIPSTAAEQGNLLDTIRLAGVDCLFAD